MPEGAATGRAPYCRCPQCRRVAGLEVRSPIGNSAEFPHASDRTRRQLRERAGFDRVRKGGVGEVSTGDRGVKGEGTSPNGADGVSNKVALDRGLDRGGPVPENVDPVEASLAKARDGAKAAGSFDVVAQIAKELEARRVAGMRNVSFLASKSAQVR